MKSKWPNLWHLQVLIAAMEAQNLSKAALQLQLTQSAVSQALAGLEAHFEVPLARRDQGRIQPTPAGALLMKRAMRMLEFLSNGLRDAADIPRRHAIQLIRAISAARLESLGAIVRHQGFAPAARAAGVSSPTLHRAARDLERSLGFDLFEATSYGVRPSREAEIIACAAALAFAEISQATAEIDSLAGIESGRTVIGAMPLARTHLVPVSVEAFSRKHADHHITIVEGAYDDLLAGLRRGEIDFLIGALRQELLLKDVMEEELFVDRLALVMRTGHPLTSAKRVAKRTLREQSWVAPRAESPLRRHFDSMFAPDVPPHDFIECNSLSAARVILMNSDRLALMSDAQIRYEKNAGMLASKSAPGPVRKRLIGLTRRKSWRPTQIQQALMAKLKSNARSS